MRCSRKPWIVLMCAAFGFGASVAHGQGGGGACCRPAGTARSPRTTWRSGSARRPRCPIRAARRAGHPPAGQDSWESLRSVVAVAPAAIDSVANVSGVSRPGLAFVTFFGQRDNARFDPQSLTVRVRSREFRPLGIVPFSGQFTSQQLDVRQQVSGIFLFEQDLPVNDSFIVLYGGQTSDDWQGKQRTLDRERARVALRERDSARDTTRPTSTPDSAAADSAR